MRSNRFGISVIVQALLLALTGGASVIIITADHLLVTKAAFAAVWIVQLIVLIWYVNSTNRELDEFLESLKYLDKVKLSGSGKNFRRLNLTYNRIIDIIRTERTLREEQFRYFRDTVEHINTGLISFGEDGRISIMNRAATEILDCRVCRRIEELGERVSPALLSAIRSLEPGRPRLVSLTAGGKLLKLSLNLALFRIRGESVRLVSLADIRGELEEGELEAWQKLIRVLTHEIVNSVTPINTLTTAMLSRLKKPGVTGDELVRNLSPGIQAIRKRNSGLLDFVENFRRISRVPQPKIRRIEMEDFFANLRSFLKEELRNIELEFKVTENLSIEADEELLVQLMINLLKNAAEAGADRVETAAGQGPGGRPRIQVSDNGKGIEKEDLDRIFIPFYSSKKDGSGIGLALSRQIMRLHRGTISVDSTPGTGTTFTLSF